MIIDMTLTYNPILGRPLLHHINAIINPRNLALKFPTQKRVNKVWGNQVTSKTLYLYLLEGKKFPSIKPPKILEKKLKVWTEVAEELRDVILEEHEYIVMNMGSTLTPA